MDEVCMVCSKVLEEGFLRVEGIGIDPKLLPSQKVWVHTRGGERLRGVIGMLAPHLQTAETKSKVSNFDTLFVDVSMHDIGKFNTGDFITYDNEPFEANGKLFTKTLDNRASCMASITALDYLSHMRHAYDYYAVFSSREEIGAFGARTAISLIQPSVAIAMDATFSNVAIPNNKKVEMGKGPVIAKGPVLTKIVSEKLIACCKDNGIEMQLEVCSRRTGTDADELQLEGYPTGLVSIPSSYMHTPYEKMSIKDITETGRLLAIYCSQLDERSFEIKSDAEGEDA
jgi:endoglucanase